MTQPTYGTEPEAEPGAGPTMPVAAVAGLPAEPGLPAEAEPVPSTVRNVQYKGSELDSARGPGLGCFRFQLIVLATLIVVTPLGVNAGWPDWLTTILLFATLALLLVAGQTIIFLLRLVAADRRGRRRPLASQTRTVGELADAGVLAEPPAALPAIPSDDGEDGDRSVRQ